ncbi:MAG: hypothetical protein Homavirus6_3 [Homavirus sp.]|uniref:Uncharacterized protein n=1 Tax=Homavirus sp. TaxID=2487769 RepID=A0A3G5A4Q7_9VIRU|nr:MAG: hypothetical protein Homavirus6_3 [Homavirus sp.]
MGPEKLKNVIKIIENDYNQTKQNMLLQLEKQQEIINKLQQEMEELKEVYSTNNINI